MAIDIGKFIGNKNQVQGNIHVDLNKIENTGCVKCDCKTFTMLGTIKMISPIQSKSGKWDTAIQAQWVCSECKHPFNANEWLKKEADELSKLQNNKADA